MLEAQCHVSAFNLPSCQLRIIFLQYVVIIMVPCSEWPATATRVDDSVTVSQSEGFHVQPQLGNLATIPFARAPDYGK